MYIYNNARNLFLTLLIPLLGLTLESALGKTITPLQQPTPLIQGYSDRGNITGANCEPLKLTACRSLGFYTHIHLPNALGHSTQHEVSRALTKFSSMLQAEGCGEWLSTLLCLTYAPPCGPPPGTARRRGVLPRGVPACRQLCASAWAGCWNHLEKVGMKWPHALDCEMLPIGLEEDGRECVMKKGRLVNHTGLYEEAHPTKAAPRTPPPEPKVKTISSRSNTAKKGTTSKDAVTTTKKTTFKAPAKMKNPVKVKTITKVKDNMITKTTKVKQMKKVKDDKGIKASADKSVNGTKKHSKPSKTNAGLKPRRYDVKEPGDPELFHGWVDVQGQGAANDYCRVIGSGVKHRFLSCVLAGSSGQEHTYVSKQGFEVGHRHSWFMRDMDGDGRDDYCRCVGRSISSKITCMKAGKDGFYGSPFQPGNQFTFYVKSRVPCFGKTFNSVLGPGFSL